MSTRRQVSFRWVGRRRRARAVLASPRLASPAGKVVNFVVSSIETSVFFFAFPDATAYIAGTDQFVTREICATKGRYMEVINKLQAEKLSSLVMVNVYRIRICTAFEVFTRKIVAVVYTICIYVYIYTHVYKTVIICYSAIKSLRSSSPLIFQRRRFYSSRRGARHT